MPLVHGSVIKIVDICPGTVEPYYLKYNEQVFHFKARKGSCRRNYKNYYDKCAYHK